MRREERADPHAPVSAAAEHEAETPRRDVPPILALQATVGNAAVSRLLAGRRVLHRMAVDKVTVDPDKVEPGDADTYLTHWAARTEAQIKLEVSSEEVLKLARRFLSTHQDATTHAAARRDLDEVPKRLTPVLNAAPGYERFVSEIETLVASANEREGAVQVTGWGFEIAGRNRPGLEKAVLASLRIRTQILQQANAKVRAIGRSVGLPALDEETVGEFQQLEATKARSREERAPLDELLTKYVDAVSKIIPGAALVYRGSVARGVKSPSKFVETEEGIAMAEFDAPETFKANPKEKYAKQTEDPSYDVDANIEVPDKKFRELKLREGPLSQNSRDIPAVRALLDLEGQIDADIRTNLTEKMPSLDTKSKFALFVSSVGGKSEAQLEGGTPYPPYMLEHAGYPKLAETLPTAYAAELANKVVEYYTTQMIHRPTGRVKPLEFWEPYFAELYDHVKTKGPQAVFMPEVQVDLTAKREFTQSAVARDTSEYRGPVDLVASRRAQWLSEATSAASLTPRTYLPGRISKIVTPRDPNKKPFAFVDVGGGFEAICFSYGGLDEGRRAIFIVTAAPAGQKKAEVQWTNT